MKNSESKVFCRTAEIDFKDVEVLIETVPIIKLFKIELPKYHDITEILLKTLTPLEAERAGRYRRINDKNRFIICRSILKYLLAKETGCDISKIQFATSITHKPYFPLNRSLFFNVSHAGDYAVIAIGTCELGVDIEFIDMKFDFNEILNSVFNEKEIDLIRNADMSRNEFYKFWTRKEAIVKAIGKGIDEDFLKIPVTDGSYPIPTSLVSGFKNINVFSFNLNSDYIGALAITEDMQDFDRMVFYPIPTQDELKSAIC